jgi:hypothetical protein
MKRILLAITILAASLSTAAYASNLGKHRVGGYNSHDKGSHYYMADAADDAEAAAQAAQETADRARAAADAARSEEGNRE